ncbi:tRNA cyclic N6-threonylcarbamoyladenosine(37) synthase TcdA [Azoarcus indigens]|uniref:tRNA A37 threonylcarbamoyladenosine dehydratase n=1 Tax=Azoarcus indigens TaxID=29545 RepID=A0A4R6E3I1_9RHOO|nr:tRNA threonylcarbamoyladenosine dehydratase [Azoarcus indigens]NMG64539.1 tRNA cyclic N6-threonylcarbamoyladenosine(37) synthase TcdA [Azoarcus indigens]TDN52367.1 tRNA A37 threonylcarbamoyladenosine dehydratase [Azoarcus indigens]
MSLPLAPERSLPSLAGEADPARRFGGLDRLYGVGAVERLAQSHVCVVGIGGVGSWVAEALARSGVGRLTLVDLDNVAESNINRQIHALDGTLGQPKVQAMAERIAEINPAARVVQVEDFLTPENAAGLLQGMDHVVDAIDNVRAKVAIAAVCRAHGLRLVMAGGAGGKADPTRIRVDDLARTEQDPLLAKVRAALRKNHGFPRDPRRKFGIEAVYSVEPLRYPIAACAPGQAPQGLACAGYGSSVAMTASVGLFAAARVLGRLVEQEPQP